MADLKDFSSPWYSLLHKLKKGYRVERKDVVNLLESNIPVVDDAKPLLAKIIEGKHKFLKGKKPNKLLPTSHMGKTFVIGLVDAFERELQKLKDGEVSELENYFNQHKCEDSSERLADMVKGGGITPKQAAEKIAAQNLDCTERIVQEMRSEVKDK